MNLNTVETEKLYQKLLRWIGKLKQSEDPRVQFNLLDPVESAQLSSKLYLMLQSLQFSIQQEWIEEYSVEDNLTRQSGSKLLYKLPLNDAQNHVQIGLEFKQVKQYSIESNDGQLLKCGNCSYQIWNRCWSFKNGKSDVVYCSECVLEESQDIPMEKIKLMQRFGAKYLIDIYKEGLQLFKKYFKQDLDFDDDLKPFANRFDFFGQDQFFSQFSSDSEFSITTICYWLHLRALYKVPSTSCHRCRQRRPSTMLVTCRNEDHASNKSTGYYMCFNCISKHFDQSWIDLIKDRNYTCVVCQDVCHCATCLQRVKAKKSKLVQSQSNSSTSSKSSVSSISRKTPITTDAKNRILARKSSIKTDTQSSNPSQLYSQKRKSSNLSVAQLSSELSNFPPRKRLTRLWSAISQRTTEQIIDDIDASMMMDDGHTKNLKEQMLENKCQVLEKENLVLRLLMLSQNKM